MESPAPVSRYTSGRNSKKRGFVDSSSSSGCKDVEIFEQPPLVFSSPQSRPSKRKEVICHEIIDLEMEEASDAGLLINVEVGTSTKDKGVAQDFLIDRSSSGNSILKSKNGIDEPHNSVGGDDSDSSPFFKDNEWIENIYDDIVFEDDDYGNQYLVKHFDKMDMPAGVEAHFPWLSIPVGKQTTVPTACISTKRSPQVQLDSVNPPTSLKFGKQSGIISQPKGSKWRGPSGYRDKCETSTSAYQVPSVTHGVSSWHARKPVASNNAYFGNHRMHTGPLHWFNSGLGSFPGMMPSVSPPSYLPASVSERSWIHSASAVGELLLNLLPGDVNNVKAMPSTETPLPKVVEHRNKEKIGSFRKFDSVEDCKDHHFFNQKASLKQSKDWAKTIHSEWKILENDLPDKIFVRVCETRMDLLRAAIIGAEGTPYHDGLFFFDVFFPASYPRVPPLVHYQSGGLRINPNLYGCGKVCLSLLNTWNGSQKEKWIPGESTMLQVLVSIQALILNAEPYFNEPGYLCTKGSASGQKKSFEYSERTFIHSLQTMVYGMRRPPKHFEELVRDHFRSRGCHILISCKAYLEGAQVGCLVEGGIQDVDEGEKSSSAEFKMSLSGFMGTLVNTLRQNGVEDSERFDRLAAAVTRRI